MYGQVFRDFLASFWVASLSSLVCGGLGKILKRGSRNYAITFSSSGGRCNRIERVVLLMVWGFVDRKGLWRWKKLILVLMATPL